MSGVETSKAKCIVLSRLRRLSGMLWLWLWHEVRAEIRTEYGMYGSVHMRVAQFGDGGFFWSADEMRDAPGASRANFQEN